MYISEILKSWHLSLLNSVSYKKLTKDHDNDNYVKYKDDINGKKSIGTI
jgi:hypothetical protein